MIVRIVTHGLKKTQWAFLTSYLELILQFPLNPLSHVTESHLPLP